MIRYQVRYSHDAVNDLMNIFEYITHVELEASNATNVIIELKNAVQSLNTFPYRHKVFKKLRSSNKEIRMFVVKGYAIFYEVDKEAKTVNIDAIISCKRDLDKIIN